MNIKLPKIKALEKMTKKELVTLMNWADNEIEEYEAFIDKINKELIRRSHL